MCRTIWDLENSLDIEIRTGTAIAVEVGGPVGMQVACVADWRTDPDGYDYLTVSSNGALFEVRVDEPIVAQ